MTPLQVVDRVFALQLAEFDGWNLPCTDACAAQMLADQRKGIPRFAFTAAAFAEVAGGLPDLPDDADDEAVLELVRHGMVLCRLGIASGDEWLTARNSVYDQWAASVKAGAELEQSIKHHINNN